MSQHPTKQDKPLAVLYLTNTSAREWWSYFPWLPLHNTSIVRPPASTICCGHEGDSQQLGHPAVGLPLPQLHRGENGPPKGRIWRGLQRLLL